MFETINRTNCIYERMSLILFVIAKLIVIITLIIFTLFIITLFPANEISINTNNDRAILSGLDVAAYASLAGSGVSGIGSGVLSGGSSSKGSAKGSQSSLIDQTSSSQSSSTKIGHWSHQLCTIQPNDNQFTAQAIAWYTSGIFSSHSVIAVLFREKNETFSNQPLRDMIVTAELIAVKDKDYDKLLTKTKCRRFPMEYNTDAQQLDEYIKLDGEMTDINGDNNAETYNGLNYFSYTWNEPVNITNTAVSLMDFLSKVDKFNKMEYKIGSYNCNTMAYELWTELFKQDKNIKQPSKDKGMFVEKLGNLGASVVGSGGSVGSLNSGPLVGGAAVS